MRNFKKTDFREETSAKTGTQKWNEEPRHKTAAALKIERTSEGFYRKAFGLEFVK
jgi:hypothetical protein